MPVSSANTPAQTPVSTDNVERYKFELGNISVMPEEALVGTPVQVIVPVKNVGSAKNAYIATLYVDGQEYLTEDITLDPGNNGTLLYLVSNLSTGKHIITVADLAGTVQIYYAEKYAIANNDIYLPHYSPLEYTPEPPLPHNSADSFTPPVTPFYITKISFRYPYPQSFQILDAGNKLLYSADIAYNESAYVPGIQVDGPFTIQMQTGQPVADVRAEHPGRFSWVFVIAYFWPEVSTVEGIEKRFVP
ncbi:MAG: hypothetical protein NTZ34_03405 [Chloroflexi bacterium]|nr:hypothetical protein [Chloroflexota bacterium]